MGGDRNDSHDDDAAIIDSNGHVYGWRVNQAAGMVSVQADCSIAAALELLIAYATQHECTVEHTVSDVVERRLRFDNDN
ncbi:MAG: hypothetical protein ABIQ73_22045 [Acidimicrobiales bacterium]